MSIQQIVPQTITNSSHYVMVKKIYKNGLVVEDIQIGEGEEVSGCDTVTVHYTACIKDGKIFDSTYKRSQPLTIALGQGSVILGLEQGLVGMKVGGVRKLTIPSEMGFGTRIMPGIPSDSELIFEVELLDICDW